MKPVVAAAPLSLLIVALGLVTVSGCHKTAEGDSKLPAADSKASDEGDKASKGDTADKPDAADKGEKADADASPTVSLATVQMGTAEKEMPVTGTLIAYRDRQASLSPPVAGIVEALPVHTGETVARGQVVLQLSTRTLEGQIDQARAAIRQNEIQVQQAEANALQQQGQTQTGILQAQIAVSGAQATLAGAQATLTGNEAALENARQALARAQSLNKEGLVAQKDVEAADLAVRSAQSQVDSQRQAVQAQQETIAGLKQAAKASENGHLQDLVKRKDIAVARQQLASAQAALATLEAQRAQYTVRAPISGTVTAVGASVGEAVDTTTKALNISDLSRLQLQIAVPAVSASAVHVGQPVRFTIESLPGHTFRTVIRRVGTQIDPTNGTLTALADVGDSGGVLKDNLSARVGIITARHTGALIAPRAAVLFEETPTGTEASVLRIDKDDVVHKVPVKTGFTETDTVEILSGVHAGDKIVTNGAYGLPDGTKVQVADEDTKASKP